MNRLAAFLIALAALPACGDPEPLGLDEADHRQASELVQSFAGALKAQLQSALAADGPVAGVRVCAERAPEIAREVTADHPEWSIRRIGTRVRNAATNTPGSADRAVLDAFAAMPVDDRPGPLVAAAADHPRRLYKPIFLAEPICLTCHGSPDQMPDAVRQEIARSYPGDEATGYTLGDLRGAFVIEKR